jgi:predicted negative regulator of RcsB-dependent stress response
MNQILDYIVQNSAWFIGGVILIVLAVIGYYADKTNFGQGKNASPEKQKTLDISQTLSLPII